MTTRVRLAAACAALAIAVLLAHGGALGAGFVFDDRLYVTENPQVQAGLSPGSVAWAFRMDERAAYYHPLTWLSLMLDWELFGPRANGFHAVNLALHAIAAILLFLALDTATGRPWPSLVAAALWAIHPLTVEGVAWVTERKAVLSGALGMGAVLAYSRHARAPSRGKLAAVAALQAASLLAKPGLVVLPAMLLALDLWPLRRVPPPGTPGWVLAIRRAMVEKIPVVVVSAVSLAVAVVSVRHFVQESPMPSFALRLANAIAVVPRYLAAAIWPVRLSVFHPFPSSVSVARLAAGIVAVVALTALALRLARSRPWLLAGWTWFLVALAPYLGLKQAGLWPEWADRFAYVPLMGLVIAAVFEGAEHVRGATSRAVAAATALAVTVALALATRAQTTHWQDSEALYRRGVAIEPSSAVMHSNLASVLIRISRLDEALAHLRVAVSLEPANASARYNLGLALARASRPGEAVLHLQEAVRLRAVYPPAHSQLATVLRSLGQLAEAERHYRLALRQEPDQPEATWNLADLLASSGRLSEALPLYVRFLEIAPSSRFAPQRRQAERILGR